MGFGVWGFECGVLGLGFLVLGLWLRSWGLEFERWVSFLEVSVFRVQGSDRVFGYMGSSFRGLTLYLTAPQMNPA